MIASVHQIHGGGKYHSQILATINSPKSAGVNLSKLNLETITMTAGSANGGGMSIIGATTGSALNVASATIHLPPLQTTRPTFPERQRRTQLLQRQRLRKEFFHGDHIT